jgi:hypothetical protein
MICVHCLQPIFLNNIIMVRIENNATFKLYITKGDRICVLSFNAVQPDIR